MEKYPHSDWRSIKASFQSDGYAIVQGQEVRRNCYYPVAGYDWRKGIANRLCTCSHGRKSYLEDTFTLLKTCKYFALLGLVPDSDQLEELRIAADLVTEETRRRNWPYKRTVGKQFPPWNNESPDVWGVQHIMHPDLNQPAFARLYFSSRLLELTAQLCNQSLEENSMTGLLNLLVEPKDHHFGLNWHRDSIQSNVDEEEETVRLSAKAQHGGVQWNLALYTDHCLFAVPRSHLRPRTAVERMVTIDNEKGEMPDGICVKLEPGEAVFYDPQILHRGTYDRYKKRRTLHGAHLDCRSDISQAAGILQHFVRSGMFYADQAFQDSLPFRDTRSRLMTIRMVEWAQRAKQSGFDGFVQDDI